MVGAMKLFAALLLATIEIGGAFGSASADFESRSDTSMTVDIEVDLRTSAQAVVAHLAFGDEPNITLPLLDRGGGTFGIKTELAWKNYLVVFEAIGDPGGVSDPVSLEDLGADLNLEGSGVESGEDPDDGLSSETRQAGWLALALVAASLSALAFWALGGRDDGDAPVEEEASSEEEE